MLNNIILMGRLTADPELRTTNSGVNYCRFSIAVDRAYTKGDDKKTDFFNCVAWRANGEFISRYFTKGQMIAVQGAMQQESYTDKDGNKRTSYTVNVEKASFTGSRSESGADTQTQPTAQQRSASPMPAPDISPDISDDLPF